MPVTLRKPASPQDWLRIRLLYRRAFPRYERKPFQIIRRMHKEGRTDVWLAEQDGLFSGLAATINGDDVILLDERGKEYSSMELAKIIQDKISYAGKDIVYVIGGAYGFSEAVYRRANSRLSLSRMTFSHQMVRAIFAEQIYRAFTIMRGEPYHHE